MTGAMGRFLAVSAFVAAVALSGCDGNGIGANGDVREDDLLGMWRQVDAFNGPPGCVWYRETILFKPGGEAEVQEYEGPERSWSKVVYTVDGNRVRIDFQTEGGPCASSVREGAFDKTVLDLTDKVGWGLAYVKER